MPVQINIKLDAEKVGKAIRELGRKGVVTAANQALNKTSQGVFTEAKRMLQKEIGLKNQKTIKRRTKVLRSSVRTLQAGIKFTEDNIPLSAIKSVKVSRSGRRKGYGRYSSVTWRGRKVKGAFRLASVSTTKGAGAALKDDIWLSGTNARYKSTGNRKIYRAYGYTLLQEYRHKRIHEKLVPPVKRRLDTEWIRAFKNQMRRRGF